MTPVLLVEIVAACVAFVCLVVLALTCVVVLVRSKGSLRRAPRWHVAVAGVMCAASAVHGAAAMLYGSGAPAAAYVLGWLAVAAFCASGACVSKPGRSRLGEKAVSCHVGFFVLGVLLVVVHAKAGRM